MSFNLELESGQSVKLPTAGKYCDRDIVVTGNGYTDADLQAKYDDGVAAGIEEGKQAEYDAFWDALQQNGTRTGYECTFGAGWNDAIFKPKYDICPASAYMMFRSSNITDLKNIPVKLDFSKANNVQYMLTYSKVKYLGEVDLRALITPTSMTFSDCPLITIDKLILKDDGTQRLDSTMFSNAVSLENLTIEGVIGKSMSLQWSTNLSKASIESVVNALSDATVELTLTLSKTAVDNAFETGDGAADGSTSTEWADLANTKSNWTISLV